jgi:hypothetical protein
MAADFATEATALLETALRQFAEWAAENYQMGPGEAECLSEPTEAPAAYTRGYNDAIRAIPDAIDLCLEEYQ